MKVIEFDRSLHYDEVCKWWKQHAGVDADIDNFIPDKGYLVEHEGINLVATWLYVSRPAAWICWTIANPLVEKTNRGVAIDTLLKHIIEYVESREDIKVCYSSLEMKPYTESLTNKFKELKFQELTPHKILIRQRG